jgi:hypothetical protein
VTIANSLSSIVQQHDIGDNGSRRRSRLVHASLPCGDPAARIADIENVEIVFKDGVGDDTGRLLESVQGRYGEY